MLEEVFKYFRLLLFSLITKSEYLTIPVTQTPDQGIKIGEGKCKAVILKLNNFTRNNTAGLAITATYFYYGDSTEQERECLRGISSDLIFCTDLNQVYIRNPFAATVNIQVLILK